MRAVLVGGRRRRALVPFRGWRDSAGQTQTRPRLPDVVLRMSWLPARRHPPTITKTSPLEEPMRSHRPSWITIPTLAVLATGLAAALLVATIDPLPAQATPGKARDCTGCHCSGSVAGTVRATPSTTSPAPGAAYTVAVTAPAGTGNTGDWITEPLYTRANHATH